MSDVEKPAYGKGFALRMTVLIGLLALVAVGFYYDRFVLPEKTDTIINEAYDLMNKPLDGSGITKQVVQETIGFAPQATSNQDGYEIETYSFGRAIPFLKGSFVNVIYENGSLVQILRDQEYDPEKVKMKIGIRKPDPEKMKGVRRNIGTAGPAPPDEDDADDEESDDEEASDDETENKNEKSGDADDDDGTEGEKAEDDSEANDDGQ